MAKMLMAVTEMDEEDEEDVEVMAVETTTSVPPAPSSCQGSSHKIGTLDDTTST